MNFSFFPEALVFDTRLRNFTLSVRHPNEIVKKTIREVLSPYGSETLTGQYGKYSRAYLQSDTEDFILVEFWSRNEDIILRFVLLLEEEINERIKKAT